MRLDIDPIVHSRNLDRWSTTWGDSFTAKLILEACEELYCCECRRPSLDASTSFSHFKEGKFVNKRRAEVIRTNMTADFVDHDGPNVALHDWFLGLSRYRQ